MKRSCFAVSLLLILAAVEQARAQEAEGGCVLLSREEVESSIGEEIARPRPWSNEMLGVKSTGCSYRGDTWRIEVRLERGRDAEGVKGYLKTLKGVAKQTTASEGKPVTGLGGEGWWAPINPHNGILHVVRGTDVLWVQSYGDKAAGAGTLPKTKALMEKVLANYEKVKSKL